MAKVSDVSDRTSQSASFPLRVLGIDPGSRNLGYGIVEKDGNRLKALAWGTLRFDSKKDLVHRLDDIHREVGGLFEPWHPHHVAVEKVFFAKDAIAALKLGQARGVAILAAIQRGCQFFEYSPNEVKRSVVGHGHADKEQVAKMMSLLLRIDRFETPDASDALAIAVCHLNSYAYRSRMNQALQGGPLP